MPFFITGDCIGCSACAKICPVLAISGEPKQRYEINIRRCVSCGVCRRVCPKNAVLDGHGNPCKNIPRKNWKKPSIDTKLCSACGICVTWCRAEALRISPPAFHGDIHVFAQLHEPAKCVSCALCEENCPLGAITMTEAQA